MEAFDQLEKNSKKILARDIKISKLSINLFSIISVFFGFLIIGIGLIIGSNPEVRDPLIKNWVLSKVEEVSITVGTSIVASVIFYWFYSITAEKTILQEVTTDVSEKFQSLFEKMLPQKVFPATIFPTDEYNECFDDLMNRSQKFWYKGDTANYTTYRLEELASQRKALIGKDIRILILDPRADQLIQERVNVEKLIPLMDRKQYSNKVQEMRTRIFVSIVALFDICYRIKIELGLYSDNMFFRSEIMDDGLFLTYCVGGEYPSTYLYSKLSTNYQAFMLDFTQTWKSIPDDNKMILDGRRSDKDLQETLTKLGCQMSIEGLRKLKEERFEGHKKKILQISA